MLLTKPPTTDEVCFIHVVRGNEKQLPGMQEENEISMCLFMYVCSSKYSQWWNKKEIKKQTKGKHRMIPAMAGY